MDDQKNLILAIVLSIIILIGFQYYFVEPQLPPQQQQQQGQQQGANVDPNVPAPKAEGTGQATPGVPGTAQPNQPAANREDALAKSARVTIDSARLSGSISLKGGRIDDMALRDYRQTLDPESPNVVVLSPQGGPKPYFIRFGWSTAGNGVALPDNETVWQADRTELTPGKPVTLSWDNGTGLVFKRVISLDENYMFTVTQEVVNNSGQSRTLSPYGLIARIGLPETSGFYIQHEGPLGVLEGTLNEIDYEDLMEKGEEFTSTGGWVGITDKYWLTALAPDAAHPFTAGFRHSRNGQDRFQVDYLRPPVDIADGATASVTNHLFVGAKEVKLLEKYAEDLKIEKFELAIDFGWLHFLTKPLFKVLNYFYGLIGNMGLAIILLTVCIKIVFFPLANKSYKSMSKMKALQPEIEKLRERHGDDRAKLNQAMMAMYKEQKVNPAAGCLPILVQIPVFFALYKVLYVTIEMRHAPFFGWIKDLSAPDPTTLFNLFGLIPWDPPNFLMIGIWPLAMGISMYMQQLLNPQPADPIQAKVFKFMPLFFTFLLAPFAAGLVVYWTVNNVLSMAQQWVIMKRMGVPIGGGTTATKKKET